jgi:Protein kinase domain
VSRATDPPLNPPRDPGPPATIAGYRLDGYLGHGSMAVVYRAVDERMHRLVALKVLAPEPAGDAAFRAKVIGESRAAAQVGHPHILPVYEAGEAHGTVFVAMRYAAGGDARSLLSRLGALPFGYAWRLIAEIASALDAAHAHGLVHCDVRPANILLDAPGTTGGTAGARDHAYLSGFGLSRSFSPGQVIAAGESAGALDYVAPERIDGRALDGRADQYSLACAAFELLCGTPPFGQEQGPTLMYAQLYAPPPSAAAARAGLPAAVDAVLATALAKDPADRYPSCGRFAGELRSALGLRLPEPGSRPAVPTPAPEPAYEPGPDPEPAKRRNVLRPILAAALVVVVATAVALGFAMSRPSAAGRPAGSLPAAPSPGATSGPPPAATRSPEQADTEQAAAVSRVLASSAATRTALRDAVRQVRACTSLAGAVGELQNVVSQRIAESRQASSLLTGALVDGEAVKSDLISALGESLQADRDYLAWAQQQQASGCTPSGAYQTALNANQVADGAKQAFAQAWNQVAPKYGLEPILPGSF